MHPDTVGFDPSDIGTNYVGQHIIAKLRIDLGSRILSAPIDQLERYRTHRLIPVLTHDVDTISDFILVLLYMKGPLEHLIGTLPIVSRAQVAFKRIADLSAQFS